MACANDLLFIYFILFPKLYNILYKINLYEKKNKKP